MVPQRQPEVRPERQIAAPTRLRCCRDGHVALAPAVDDRRLRVARVDLTQD
jgi:hypothetical protein